MAHLPGSSFIDPTVDLESLITHYGFDLKGQTPKHLIDQWCKYYHPAWVRMAVVEALYQGRYKAISIDQILCFWRRRGGVISHFNQDFERFICNNLPRDLRSSWLQNLSPLNGATPQPETTRAPMFSPMDENQEPLESPAIAPEANTLDPMEPAAKTPEVEGDPVSWPQPEAMALEPEFSERSLPPDREEGATVLPPKLTPDHPGWQDSLFYRVPSPPEAGAIDGPPTLPPQTPSPMAPPEHTGTYPHWRSEHISVFDKTQPMAAPHPGEDPSLYVEGA